MSRARFQVSASGRLGAFYYTHKTRDLTLRDAYALANRVAPLCGLSPNFGARHSFSLNASCPLISQSGTYGAVTIERQYK